MKRKNWGVYQLQLMKHKSLISVLICVICKNLNLRGVNIHGGIRESIRTVYSKDWIESYIMIGCRMCFR